MSLWSRKWGVATERKRFAWVKPLMLVRNAWLLRRELVALIFKRREKEEPPIPVRCIRCGHTLEKACKPGAPSHVFKWPAEAGPNYPPGTLIYVRRQKARAGAFRQDYELRTRPF